MVYLPFSHLGVWPYHSCYWSGGKKSVFLTWPAMTIIVKNIAIQHIQWFLSQLEKHLQGTIMHCAINYDVITRILTGREKHGGDVWSVRNKLYCRDEIFVPGHHPLLSHTNIHKYEYEKCLIYGTSAYIYLFQCGGNVARVLILAS